MSEYAEAVEYMSSAGSVWHVRVRFEILLLLNMADMDCLLCGRLWSEECSVLRSFSGCE